MFVISDDFPGMTLQKWQEEGGAVDRRDVYVDAFTGEVLYYDLYLGGGDPKKPLPPGWRSASRLRARGRRKPPPVALPGQSGDPMKSPPVTINGAAIPDAMYPVRLIRGVPYWYAGYLKSPAWGMTLRRHGKQLELVDRSGRHSVLTDDRRQADLGGRPFAARAPVRNVSGRTYLPLDLWRG